MSDWWSRFFGGAAAPPMTLVESPVVLKPPVREDFEAWSAVMSRDGEVLAARQPTWPEKYLTRTAFLERVNFTDRERMRGTGFYFHVFAEADARFLGAANLAPVHYGAARSGTLGYWIAEPEWGEGYATAAVKAIIDYAFGELGLARLDAHCLPDNPGSIRVLEKSGFQREGVLKSFLEIDGERRDHLIFGRLPDFEK